MPLWPIAYRVFIASPSDVAEERQAIRLRIFGWNDAHATDHNTVLLPVMWETHALPKWEIAPRPC